MTSKPEVISRRADRAITSGLPFISGQSSASYFKKKSRWEVLFFFSRIFFQEEAVRLAAKILEIRRCRKDPKRNRSSLAICPDARCADHPTRRRPSETRENGQRLAAKAD